MRIEVKASVGVELELGSHLLCLHVLAFAYASFSCRACGVVLHITKKDETSRVGVGVFHCEEVICIYLHLVGLSNF
jgi:hypothetical protein